MVFRISINFLLIRAIKLVHRIEGLDALRICDSSGSSVLRLQGSGSYDSILDVVVTACAKSRRVDTGTDGLLLSGILLGKEGSQRSLNSLTCPITASKVHRLSI